MPEREIFVLADTALNGVVAQIKDDQWAMQIPEWFARSQKDGPTTLREIINYHAYDDAWVPDMLAGKTMEEAGKDNFKGDVLKDDPKGNFAAIVDRATTAARELDNLESTVHTSFGDFTTQQYLWQANMFRGLRTRDIAKLIGVDAGMSDELVKGLWDEISPQAEQWRKIGVFQAAVPVSDDAPLMDRLLGVTGRDPNVP